jgi:hypothetical protein
MRLLYIALLTIGILTVITAILILWKRSKDISDMKSGQEKIYKMLMKCSNLKKSADCYVDALVSKFGWLKAKDIFNGQGDKPTEKQAEWILSKMNNCCK